MKFGAVSKTTLRMEQLVSQDKELRQEIEEIMSNVEV